VTKVLTDWTSDRLKDVAAINAVSLSPDTDPDYEFEYLEISNVNYYGVVDPEAVEHLRYEDAPSRARRRVRRNSTVISSVRPNLQAVAFFPDGSEHLVCSTGFNVVEPHGAKLQPKFVYYALISEGARQHFDATAKGVGYPAVDDKDFNALSVPLPSMREQERIVAYLDASCAAIDSAVVAKRNQLETLDALRKDVIQRVVTRGINQSTELVRTGNTWIEEVPAGWDLIALKRVSEIQTGLTLGKVYEGPLIERPYLRVANVQDGHLDLTDVTMIDVPRHVAKRVELRVDDVLMTEGGDLDKLARGFLWNGEISGCLHQNHIFAVRCFAHKLLPKFLTYVTASRYGRDYFEATGKRTTNLASTNSTKVGLFPLPLPSVQEQARLVKYLADQLNSLSALFRNLETQVETLISYRTSLIHECVTGQRRIDEADVTRVTAHV
jgi:type I restriction enzyme S subunit